MHGAVTHRGASGLCYGVFTGIAADSGHSQPCFRISKNVGQSLLFPARWLEKCFCQRQTQKSRLVIVKADAATNDGGNRIAPLQPESPSGQFLVELLQKHPHLFLAAAEQQLERLAEDRDATTGQKDATTGQKGSACAGNELLLYKRIAECRAKERRKTVEEIMYAIVSQKFVEAGISMVPSLSPPSGSQRIDIGQIQDKKLESVHSVEALEMIQEHLAHVLGQKGVSDLLDHKVMIDIGKMHMGQVYAGSVVYGYFIRRVDERFQLEKSMRNFTNRSADLESDVFQRLILEGVLKDDDLVAEAVTTVMSLGGSHSGRAWKPALRKYVMSFDETTLHHYATIRSKESASVIQKHTEALFGKPKLELSPDGSMVIVKDEVLTLSLSSLKRLILEAAGFGSFLWDVETYVDTHYNIVVI